MNTSRIIHDRQFRNFVTTTLTLVTAVGSLPVCNSTCFSSTFYTNYYAISLRVARVNACRRLVNSRNERSFKKNWNQNLKSFEKLEHKHKQFPLFATEAKVDLELIYPPTSCHRETLIKNFANITLYGVRTRRFVRRVAPKATSGPPKWKYLGAF